MITFLAGPAVSMPPPVDASRSTHERFSVRLRKLLFGQLQTSRDCPSSDHSQPDRNESDYHTEDHVRSCHQQFSVLDAAKCFIFECRERRVCANKPDGDEIAPVGVPVSPFGEKSKNKPDEKRSSAIDDERAIGKSRPHTIADIAAKPKPGDRANETSNAYNQIPTHELAYLSFPSVSNRLLANNLQHSDRAARPKRATRRRFAQRDAPQR